MVAEKETAVGITLLPSAASAGQELWQLKLGRSMLSARLKSFHNILTLISMHKPFYLYSWQVLTNRSMFTKSQARRRETCISWQFRNTTGNTTAKQPFSSCGGGKGEVSDLGKIIQRIRKQFFSCLLPSSPSRLTLDLPLIVTNVEDIISLPVWNKG